LTGFIAIILPISPTTRFDRSQGLPVLASLNSTAMKRPNHRDSATHARRISSRANTSSCCRTGKDIYAVAERYLDLDPSLVFLILDEDFLLNKKRAMEFRDCVMQGREETFDLRVLQHQGHQPIHRGGNSGDGH
jgi:hypothetical protein